MSTLADAHMRLLDRLAERRRAGQPAEFDQIDAVLCEDGATILAYVYAEGVEDPIMAMNIDGEPFEPGRIERELMAPLCLVLH